MHFPLYPSCIQCPKDYGCVLRIRSLLLLLLARLLRWQRKELAHPTRHLEPRSAGGHGAQ